MSILAKFFLVVGGLGEFTIRILANAVRPPFEFRQLWSQLHEVGTRSLSLVVASGLALGIVMTLHTRSTLVTFGAASMIPTVQSLAFFIEIGPLVVGLLVAGRVGSGIGAVLANMRAAEQIDAIESLSIDSFKFLVVPRVLACVIALPLLTMFMDFAGLIGGFLAEYSVSHLSLNLYLLRAFARLNWTNYIPPTLKTAVFGLVIGSVSSFYGYSSRGGSAGVGRASTNSVVTSSLLIIVADVVIVKCIFLIFGSNAT